MKSKFPRLSFLTKKWKDKKEKKKMIRLESRLMHPFYLIIYMYINEVEKMNLKWSL